jgi:hypothetical protein
LGAATGVPSVVAQCLSDDTAATKRWLKLQRRLLRDTPAEMESC